MKDRSANMIVSVCEVEHSPLWMNTLSKNNSMENFINSNIVGLPRQELEKYYRINGAIYIIKTEYLLKTNNIYKDKSFALIIDKKKSIDIDDELDFIIAEILIKSTNLDTL